MKKEVLNSRCWRHCTLDAGGIVLVQRLFGPRRSEIFKMKRVKFWINCEVSMNVKSNDARPVIS